MIKPKYKTIANLKKALDAGKISKDIEVVLDNDHASVKIINDDNTEYLWYGDYSYACTEQALDALGIKWRHA